MADPAEYRFGVNLVKPVTQYRQTERAAKYGILIVLLVFIAGFVVEIISKKPINLIQYMVIGASLVLFYTLLLAFSDFLAFWLAYLIAAVMTTGALGVYFAGIVKSKWAYLLTGLVALAYGVIYILLQMETFAFLAGSLLLFAILCVIMALTKKMHFDQE
ncbi:MAG: inner membrane CreD family protein [Bacteroidales bacterium]|nr:inner membrane CreD family protein [Bacteroidales bacterium]